MTTTINASRTEPIRSDLLRGWGGAPRKDPPGVRYLRDEFGLEQQLAVQQVAERDNDYGVDGFHYDRERRNLYRARSFAGQSGHCRACLSVFLILRLIRSATLCARSAASRVKMSKRIGRGSGSVMAPASSFRTVV